MPNTFRTFFESKNYYNETLHSSFWDEDGKFNEQVLKALLKIVEDFIADDDNVTEDIIEDIQLTGSLSNYNYSDKSDLDVHILLDFADINKDEDLVKRALDGRRFIWNLKHDIKLNGHEVELYFQDVHEPHTASGLFSLKNNQWIKKPAYDKPEVDHNDVVRKANEFKKEVELIEDILDNVSEEKELSLINNRAKKLKSRIQVMRKEGLTERGEFSVENLAFKNLRDSDYIAKLNDIIIKSYDLMYSDIEEEKLGLEGWMAERHCHCDHK